MFTTAHSLNTTGLASEIKLVSRKEASYDNRPFARLCHGIGSIVPCMREWHQLLLNNPMAHNGAAFDKSTDNLVRLDFQSTGLTRFRQLTP